MTPEDPTAPAPPDAAEPTAAQADPTQPAAPAAAPATGPATGPAAGPAAPPPAAAPPGRRPPSLAQRAYGLLTSPKLAIGILVVVLGCCVVGVTVYREAAAGEVIFSTLWFNGLLVLLAVSSAAAFFSRIWKRKASLVQAGMIIFHLSFLAVLGGVVVNSLFHFKGVLRLTEGETLPNGQAESYDQVEYGRFFDPAWLTGETTLVKMHTGYKVDGDDKRAAYEDRGGRAGRHHHRGHLRDPRPRARRGALPLLQGGLLGAGGHDRPGRQGPLRRARAAAELPAGRRQLPVRGGDAGGGGGVRVPTAARAPPRHPAGGLLARGGAAQRPGQPGAAPHGPAGVLAAEKKALLPVGGLLDLGDFKLSPREIRYWVGMDVRYDPGLNTSLAGLCFGLLGMVLTFAGRLRQGGAKRRAAQG
ncbi:MAG: hypothetical protein IPO09_10190 [Anaeromyxobacter sp.]|nr:hypothetical protein [Anaeromyxobacter sp.]